MAAGTPGGKKHILEPQEIAALLADEVGPDRLTEEQRAAIYEAGLTVV